MLKLAFGAVGVSHLVPTPSETGIRQRLVADLSTRSLRRARHDLVYASLQPLLRSGGSQLKGGGGKKN